MKEKISKELDRLEAEGVIEKVNYSEWAAPLVPVPKPDGRVRLLGGYDKPCFRSRSIPITTSRGLICDFKWRSEIYET